MAARNQYENPDLWRGVHESGEFPIEGDQVTVAIRHNSKWFYDVAAYYPSRWLDNYGTIIMPSYWKPIVDPL
jgi:hypothetical protein